MEQSAESMDDAAGGRTSGLTQRRLSLLGTVLVLVVGAAIVVRTVETERVFEAVRMADVGLLAAAVGVYALSWPLRGHRYDQILGVMGRRCGRGFLTAAVFVSQLANLVVPARAGDGVRAYLLKQRRSVPYTTVAYPPDCYLVFGGETRGLPDELLADRADEVVRIPTVGAARCLNLSNAVAVAAYEVARQHDFAGLETRRTLPAPRRRD